MTRTILPTSEFLQRKLISSITTPPNQMRTRMSSLTEDVKKSAEEKGADLTGVVPVEN